LRHINSWSKFIIKGNKKHQGNKLKTRLYFIIVTLVIVFIAYILWPTQHKTSNKPILKTASKIINTAQDYAESKNNPFYKLKVMLHRDAPTLRDSVINKVLTTLECANEYNVAHNNIVTIIDYSLPSNQKRLWVVDLNANKLLFHTYVSHGIKSGFLLTNNFSNKHNSKASSLGVYKTEKSYYGHEGLSLRLEGLDRTFNDQASRRSIVMHGGWYMDENFIKKYGRPGRSWGCTALPLTVSQSIINTIKEQSFFIVYYPNEQWLSKSRFLHCKRALADNNNIETIDVVDNEQKEQEPRDEVLFADIRTHAEDNPIVLINADDYKRIFTINPPLTRMVRRQINNNEYIALNNQEFKQIANTTKEELDKICFAVPELKMRRGYYLTEMKILNLGAIKNVTWSNNNYTVYFDKQTTHVSPTNRFIRWLGL
jgi:hypothetical protein